MARMRDDANWGGRPFPQVPQLQYVLIERCGQVRANRSWAIPPDRGCRQQAAGSIQRCEVKAFARTEAHLGVREQRAGK